LGFANEKINFKIFISKHKTLKFSELWYVIGSNCLIQFDLANCINWFIVYIFHHIWPKNGLKTCKKGYKQLKMTKEIITLFLQLI